jgi:putative hydrolase of the HAD superfamily
LSARFPLVAVSNGNADLARVGLAGYFKAGFSAQVFGVGKPDRRIFEAAAHAAGVPPEEVLHIGDDAELDVLAALACGMQTAWVNREDKLWPHAQEPHETVRSLAELTALF